MYSKLILSAVVLVLLGSGCAEKHALDQKSHQSKSQHWGYEGETGPLYWASLKPEYFMCKEGKNQSPVNITGTRAVEKKHIGFRYFVGGEYVVNNGHAVKVAYKPGSFVTIDDHAFELKQFHFHTPGENRIDGKSFPMEAHFVHADENGTLAVLALMFEEGAPNPELDKILKALSPKVGEKRPLPQPANASALYPMDVDYYRYSGSLTTPPCSEGVIWIVFKKPVTASADQIRAFYNLFGHPNNRPVQPINARVILR